jgi:integrase
MAIKKRGKIYWIDVTIRGERIRESLNTEDKKEAQELHDIRRSELWRDKKLGERPKRTLHDACNRWLIEKADKKSLQDDKDKIKYFEERLGSKLLSDLTRDLIEASLPQGVKASTRNRYRALIRAILRAAEREWDWLNKAPTLRVETEPRKRIAFLTREQAEALIDALPSKYRCAVRFALLTGLRRSNVFNLHWENVNLESGMAIVHDDEAKAGERILVPLNTQARELLQSMPEPHKGRVWGEITRVWCNTWKSAAERAGVPWCRFHDLRHTWASWHAMAGTPLSVLQELGGWHSASMVSRYAHLSPEHLAKAAERVTL